MENINSELSKVQEAKTKLEGVFELHGTKAPMVNVVASTRSDVVQGALADFLSIRDREPTVQKTTFTGSVYDSRD